MASRRNRTTGLATGRRERPRERTFLGLRASNGRLIVIGLIALLGVAALAIVVFALYRSTIARPSEVVLEVGDSEIKLGYVARRVEFATTGEEIPLSATLVDQVLSQIQSEELTIQAAAREGVLASMPEILNVVARRLGLPENEFGAEFEAAFEAELDATGMRREDYIRFAQAVAVEDKVRKEILQVSSTGTKVDLSVITVTTEQEALQVIERLNAGEEFEAVAREVSISPTVDQDGGNVGETALELLDEPTRNAIQATEVGGITAAPVVINRNYYVFRVNQVNEDAEYSPAEFEQIARTKLADWRQDQLTQFRIRRDFSTDDAEWVVEQVA